MGWKSWLGVNSRPTQTKQEASNGAKWITNHVMEQINALVVSIISMSWECTQAIKPHMRLNDAMKNRPEAQIAYIHFTLLAFFVRLMSVQACNSRLNRPGFVRLKETVLSIIVPSQVEAFFGNPPDKLQLQSILYDALEKEKLLDERSIKTLEDAVKSLSLDLVRDILILAGYEVGNGRLDAEAPTILNLMDQKLGEIVSQNGLAGFEFTIRSASAAIESCWGHGISIPEIVGKAIVTGTPSPA